MARGTHKRPIVLTPIETELVQPGQDLGLVITKAFEKRRLRLRRGDVVAVPSKVVSISEGRILRLDEVHCSKAAARLAKKWRMDNRLAQVVIDEADLVLGGVSGFMLTVKDNVLTPNAGVDSKNSPPGTVTLWPKNPGRSAKRLRKILEDQYRTNLCVVIVDSRITPLRLGTTGLAIGVSGFVPVRDERRKPDLYGRKVKVTQTNIADDLAASAHILMGETRERIGAVLIRNASVKLSEKSDRADAKMGIEGCLIISNLKARMPSVSHP
jgi:coenzyme F420-0:L-glutamate ligase/coenzyme F420-1:gamma-L-glutamate ligase